MKTRHFVSNIELTNSGNLSLFFLGTGNAFTKTAFQTNLLIIKGQDHLLVDCGTLCSYAFENMYNGRITDIKNLLLTHPHADHIGGVEELALEGKYITKRLVNLVKIAKIMVITLQMYSTFKIHLRSYFSNFFNI